MLLVLALPALLTAAAATQAPVPLTELQRFALAYMPYTKLSAVDVRVDRDVTTWAGRYLLVSAVRETGSPLEKKADRVQLNLLVDPVARTVSVGAVLPLDAKGAPVNRQTLPMFAERALPELLKSVIGSRVRIAGPAAPERLGPIVGLDAEISTGYGYMKMPVALTADAAYLCIGGTWPLDRDPREVRRERLANAAIQWEPGHDHAVLKIVEFSDYECPACKRGWGQLKPVLAWLGDKAHHGLINFPLVTEHPWAFPAAVAGICIGRMSPDKLIPYKEEMYRQQDLMTVESLGTAVAGFIDKVGLSQTTFKSCYMTDDPINTVLGQLAVGYSLGVLATPTYLVNGEAVDFSDGIAARMYLTALLAAGGVPERVP
jgi:Thioredoxin